MDKTLKEAVIEYLETLEKATKKLKQQISNQSKNQQTPESIFETLNFEQREGARLGEYEIAQKTANPPDTWNKALYILEKNQSTISNRYHQEGHVHSYWLYGNNHDRIYRQKLKPKEGKVD